MAFNSKTARQAGKKSSRKGSPNKATEDLRQRIDQLLSSQFDKVVAKLDELEPREYIAAWIKLLEYGLPKLQRTEITGEISDGQPFADWSENEISKELERLTRNSWADMSPEEIGAQIKEMQAYSERRNK